MVHVGYRDAFAFCVWANKRLPTEPEWQYIAQPAANNRKSLTYTHTRLTALCPGQVVLSGATIQREPIKGKGSPYSITERRVPELIPVLDCQPAGDVSHKPGGRLPLLSARPAVTLATLKRAATNFAA